MKIGLMGTGLMGLPMAQRLLAADLTVTVYNRTAAKLQPLQAAGAQIAESAVALLEASDCVILMLTDAAAIRELLLTEATRPQLRDRTIIQMGTIAPAESQAIAQAVTELGGEYLEAPVLGSIPEAKAGTLLVLVGATPEQFQQWSKLLKHFGPEPRLLGPVGAAAATKLALNQLIASLTTAFALSLGLVQRFGVETEAFMAILRQSALYAPTFDKKLTRMLQRNYAHPNFPAKHLLKDTNLFIAAAQELGLHTESLLGVRQILELTHQMGWAEADYSALYAAVNPTGDRDGDVSPSV